MGVFLLQLALITSLPTESFDSGFDVGRILHWQEEWYLSPIQISSTNASTQDVIIEFKIRLHTTINKGCIQIKFPIGFQSPQNFSDCDFSMEKNKDLTYSISLSQLPSVSKGYGQFEILTRHFLEGQIVDMNKNFGSVFVKSAVPNFESLTVTSQTEFKIAQQGTLQFQFQLDQDLSKYDYFTLEADQKWSIQAINTCQSVAPSDTLYLDGAKDSLVCVKEDNKIYIYGFKDSLMLSNYENLQSFPIKLEISNFIAPSQIGQSSNFTWQLSISQQNHIYKRYKGNGVAVSNGEITINTWIPHGDFSISDIVQSLVMYTDINFTLSNIVPISGKVEITFTNIDIKSQEWKTGSQQYCFIEFADLDLDCTINDTKFIIDVRNAPIPISKTLQISVLSQFTGASPSVSISSYSNDDTLIDSSQNRIITYSTAQVFQSVEFQLLFASDSGDNAINYSGAYKSDALKYYYAKIQFTNSNIPNSSSGPLRIHFPNNSNGLSNHQFYVSKNTNASGGPFKAKYILQETVDFADISGEQEVTAISSERFIQMQTDIDFGGKKGGVFGFYNNDAGIQPLALPKVASNLHTRYEAWQVLDIQSGKYVRFQTITINAQEFQSISLNRLCGNSVRFSFDLPFPVNTTESNYYLELQFSEDFQENLASGLSLGESYPYAIGTSSNLESNGVLTLQSYKLQYQNSITYQDDQSADTAYTFWFGLENVAGTSNIKMYFIDENEQENLLIENVNITIQTSTQQSYTYAQGSDFGVLDNSVSIETPGNHGFSTTSNTEFTMQFPSNFSFQLPSMTFTLNLQSSPSTDIKFISSTNVLFNFPAIIATNSLSSGNESLRVSGVISSNYVTGSEHGQVIFGDASNCKVTQQLSMQPGEVQIVSQMPASVTSRGPNQFGVTLSVNFKPSNDIPQGGQIVFKVDENWIVLGSVSITGLTAVTGQQITFTEQNEDYIIQGFQKVSSFSNLTITITDALPPYNNQGSNASFGHFDYIYTQIQVNSQMRRIDQAVNLGNDTCIVSPFNLPGRSSFIEVSSFPKNTGYSLSDIYLKFSLTQLIPKDSQLIVISPGVQWNINDQDQITSNQLLVNYQVQGNNLQFDTKQQVQQNNVFEIYIKRAITNPTSTSGYYLIQVKYQNLILINDQESTADQNNALVPSQSAQSNITNFTISINSYYEFADIVFRFTPTIDVEANYRYVVQFPSSSDLWIGNVYKNSPVSQPNVWNIDCESSTIGNQVLCVVDQGKLIIKNIKAITYDQNNLSETVVEIKKAFYINQGSFTVLIVDESGRMYGYADYTHNQNQQQDPSLLQIKEADYSKMSFQTPTIINETAQILLIYPAEYQMQQYINGKDFTCTNTLDVQLSCQFLDNQIEVKPEQTIASDSIITISFNALDIATWGYSRTQSTIFNPLNIDLSYSNDFRIVWTNQVKVVVKDSDQILSWSYMNANTAYASFLQNPQKLIVNEYENVNSDKILQLIPGTRSKYIEIATQSEKYPCQAQKITFTSEQNQQGFSIQQDIIMLYQSYKTYFTISTKSDTSPGLYYIDWNIDEVPLKDRQQKYNPPLRTPIEVIPNQKADFTVEKLGTVHYKGTSYPIKISTQNPPTQLVTITIALKEQTQGIVIINDTLEFDSNTDYQYFKIQVQESYQVKNEANFTLTFTISGTNTASYNTIDEKEFIVMPTEITVAGNVTKCTNTAPTRTKTSLFATPDTDGIIMYYLVAERAVDLTAEQLKSQLVDYFTGGSSMKEQIEQEIEPNESEKAMQNSWELFQKRIYVSFLQQTWVGAGLAYAGLDNELIEIDNLMSDTLYNMICVLDNLGSQLSAVSNNFFKTNPLPPASTISITFKEQNQQLTNEQIGEKLAQVIGIPQQRLLQASQSTRLLQQTSYTLSWIVPAVRNLESPTPSDLTTLTNTQKVELEQLLSDLSPPFSYSKKDMSYSEYSVPTWQNKPFIDSSNSNTFSMQCNIPAIVCGVCAKSNTPLNNQQVQFGLDSTNQAADGQCVTQQDSQSIQITFPNLQKGNEYWCTFNCYSNYPIWGIPSSLPTDTLLEVRKTEIKDDSSEDSAAWYISLSLALALL